MTQLLIAILPEAILCVVACVLFLVGCCDSSSFRKFAPLAAITALLGVFVYQVGWTESGKVLSDPWNSVSVGAMAGYIKALSAGVGAIFVLMAWPTNAEGTGNASADYGTETGEFFALLLLSIAGLMTVASANDLSLLFLGIELASIPTYIMVSMSRPLPVAQEAGVKYFFLGAMSAAVMLFGFSYLYGTTGHTNLTQIANVLAEKQGVLQPWQLLAVLLLLAGFAFKIAAVPLHVYAGDVYQGAATPVTALLAFVPKTTGFVAIIKLLSVIGGPTWTIQTQVATLLWVMAVLTMSAGNVLALLQYNVKRVLAYSSVAHTGYMLVGLATLSADVSQEAKSQALSGVLFYLAAYGIMNAGAFGVLMMLPSKDGKPATTAETFEDLAGQGRKHVGLGLAMAVACFGLIGLPLTVGFFGKLLLIKPALDGKLYWLVVITMLNAAVAAAYYLRIVAAMFLRNRPEGSVDHPLVLHTPLVMAVFASVFGSLALGIILPVTGILQSASTMAAQTQPGSHATVAARVP